MPSSRKLKLTVPQTPVPEERELITPGEVSKMLRKSIDCLAVWRSTKRHALSYYKFGRSVLYDKTDVLRFIAERRISRTEPE
jgi:hypothetical protein